jgi:hypothetical protein
VALRLPAASILSNTEDSRSDIAPGNYEESRERWLDDSYLVEMEEDDEFIDEDCIKSGLEASTAEIESGP